MKKTLQIAILILAGCGIPAMAQTAGFTRWCEQGGVPAQTSGLPSSNKLLGIVPQCDVTVYLTGTLTKRRSIQMLIARYINEPVQSHD